MVRVQDIYRQMIFSILQALIILIVVGVQAFASSPENKTKSNLVDLLLEELAEIEIVVSASKHEQTTNKAPSSVSIVTSRDIKQFG